MEIEQAEKIFTVLARIVGNREGVVVRVHVEKKEDIKKPP
jgi:hypothetical protein